MDPGTPGLTASCPGCARDNPGDSSFCGGCGQRLEPGATGTGTGTDQINRTTGVLDLARNLAEQHERQDLSRHLAGTQARLAGRILGVVVVGEFKRGKSTLVNALLQNEVCPVDADVATAVPMFVRHGDAPKATAYFGQSRDPGETALDSEPVEIGELAVFVEDSRNSGLHSVEIALPHPLLEDGLCLIDTPGVGGLESTHGAMTMGVLGSACAMVFVTDASQELTAPEMTFLKDALERVPRAVCVVSKTDIYPHWRSIVELNRAHLAAHGVDDVPVVPVSSFLQLESEQTRDESGFVDLLDWLRTEVAEPAASEAVTAAHRDLGFVREQLSLEIAAEQRVLSSPEIGPVVTEQLRASAERTRRLLEPDSQWQQRLSDGMEDLIADIHHDLDERLRRLAGRAEQLIDRTDPEQNWPTMEAWIQRQAILAATANHELLAARAADLSAEVASSFAAESGVPLRLGLSAPAELLHGVHLGQVELPPGEPLIPKMVFLGRTAAMVPSLAVPMILQHPEYIPLMGPLALILGAGIGKKILHDDYERLVHQRRQQAKTVCRAFIDEAKFVVDKDCKDSLRRTWRELRDDFGARAQVLHETSRRAMHSVERAGRLDERQRRARSAELDGDRRNLDALQRPRVEK
ncbi:dynamin family protein [Kineosporia sp. J2-2]|uniref:Dynamin family protein n=1 Tax=Kineosporia corallincola TaxID=2835133 RepID=A0ABS5TAW0_9ACTN|nr:dynamin family protein [Kineosporia corallincola]MBT0768207.1 dynamin family protein [Kineosporia corallincola]